MVAVLYDWLKAIHILAAIVWVGGSVTNQILGIRIRRTGDRQFQYQFAKQVEFVGTRLYMTASLVLLVLGIWMVSIGPWNFGMLWIDLALAMFAFSFVSGAFYIGPQLKKLTAAIDRDGMDSPAGDEILRKIFLVSRIELVLLILIVFDMVLKPGA
jgi:uncharacterized membrane protein